MNLFLFKVENLDHRNVYMIKKMIGALMREFNQAMDKKNTGHANQIRSLTQSIHNKIEPNPLWANRVNKVLTEMAKKLNAH